MLTWASVLSPEPAASHLLDYTLVVNANSDTLASRDGLSSTARTDCLPSSGRVHLPPAEFDPLAHERSVADHLRYRDPQWRGPHVLVPERVVHDDGSADGRRRVEPPGDPAVPVGELGALVGNRAVPASLSVEGSVVPDAERVSRNQSLPRE